VRKEAAAERALWTKHFEQREGSPTPAPAKRTTGRGRVKRGTQNKTEAAYEAHLNLRKIAGEVAWFRFEPITFKLADDCRWTPDFAVMLADGLFEIHDTKGTKKRTRKDGTRVAGAYIEEDARVKIEVAAAMFPFVFKTVYRVDGEWVEKEY
jgi:hypothetical protein